MIKLWITIAILLMAVGGAYAFPPSGSGCTKDCDLTGSINVDGLYVPSIDATTLTNVMPTITKIFDSNAARSDTIVSCAVGTDMVVTGHPFTDGDKIKPNTDTSCGLDIAGDYWACVQDVNTIKLDTDYGTDYACDTYFTFDNNPLTSVTLVSTHGMWTPVAVGCSFGNDSTTQLTGVRTPKMSSIQAADTCGLIGSTRLASAVDWDAGVYFRMVFKTGDFSELISSDTQFLLGDAVDGMKGGEYSVILWDEFGLKEGVAGDKDDVWQTVHIPTANIVINTANADLTDIDLIQFTFLGSEPDTFWIDEISYMDSATNGAVIVVFDDCTGYDYQASQYMAQFGYPGTSFCPGTSFTGTSNPQTGEPNLELSEGQIMRDNFNWEFAPHGNNHTNYDTKTADQVAQDISASITHLRKNGFNRGTDVFAYPGGAFSEVAKAALRPYVKAARIFDPLLNAFIGETAPPGNYYELRTFPVSTNTPIATIKTWLDRAITDKEVVILSFHGVPSQAQIDARTVTTIQSGQFEYCYDSACATIEGDNEATDNFKGVIDYLNNNGATVLSLSDWINTMPR